MKYQIGDKVRVNWVGESFYDLEGGYNTITGVDVISPEESLYRIDDGCRDSYYGEEELDPYKD